MFLLRFNTSALAFFDRQVSRSSMYLQKFCRGLSIPYLMAFRMDFVVVFPLYGSEVLFELAEHRV
jgi:hypothetical protein